MFQLVEKNNIKFLKSDIFSGSIVHAFSSRIGGNSPNPYNNFTMSTTGLDELQADVEQNRIRICTELGVDYEKLLVPEQLHTDNIKVIKKLDNTDLKATDGIITNLPNTPVMLLFADCTPIILFTEKEKVLGVIHAGWRGTAKGIVRKAVKLFKEEFDVDAKEIKAAIGPAIGQCCYPVSKEVAEQLNMSINNSYDNIFIDESDLVKVDLKRLNACQLRESGLEEIDITDYCTSCNHDIFYSYRADNGKTGRHCAIACLTSSNSK